MRRKYNQTADYLPCRQVVRLQTRDWQDGQSLIEVVVAFGVTIIIAVALITTMLYTQRSVRSARNHALATKLVQENIEQVRIFRDRNGFGSLASGNCYFLDTTDMDPKNWSFETSGCPKEETLENAKFQRSIRISDVVINEKKQIDVNVTWQESGQTIGTNGRTFLTEWDTSNLR